MRFLDSTLITVLMGTSFLGFLSGVLGCFAFLKKQSLLADAISHAALPGIALMFLMTHSKNPALLLFGGACAGLIGTILVLLITDKTTLKRDTALGFVLSVFFGFGLVLLTVIQKRAIAQQAILNKFLFGNAATLLSDEVVIIIGAGLIILACVCIFWKEFVLLSFDPLYAQAIGFSYVFWEGFLIVLLVIAIVLGLQTVGVVLMSTMFIAPAAAARQWISQMGSLVWCSGLIGFCAAIMGTVISNIIDHLPTGPTIVVVLSGCVIFSLLSAPPRGLLWLTTQKYFVKK